MTINLNTDLTLPVPPAPKKKETTVYNGCKWEHVSNAELGISSGTKGNFQIIGDLARNLFPVDQKQPVVRT